MKRAARRWKFFKNSRLFWAILFVAVLAFVWAELTVSRVLISYGNHAATTTAQAIFADTVQKLCQTEDFSAAVSLQTDETGAVTAFSGNATLQNAVQAKLAQALCVAFEQSDRASFSVPLGTLLGDPLSSGKGPSVTFFVALAESPVLTLSDTFTDAGINQTYHTVSADVRLTLLVTALGKSRQTELSLSMPISQTVVAGDVPTFYASF